MSEHQEQAALIKWADMIPEIRGKIFAIPNGSNKSRAAAAKFKAEGLRAGYPDCGLDMARRGYHGLRIEMKVKGQYPKPKQREWLNYQRDEFYYAVWCMGWEEAVAVVSWYIGLTDIEPTRRKV
jgi:hypothetical protein